MRLGKLKENELAEALSRIKYTRGEVLKGAGIGEDCAAIKCDGIILLSTDPITAATENPSALAVEINANDVYASGGEPFAAMMTVLAPPDMPAEEVISEIGKAADTAEKRGIAIIGGHTEFTDAVNRLIVSLTVLGRTDSLTSNRRCKAGDRILVTKALGIEGTDILVRTNAKCADLKDEWEKVLVKYGLSVAKESGIVKSLGVSAMHDVTEGGVYGAVAEIAGANCLGAIVYDDRLPVESITREVCDRLNIKAGGLISSGSLLIIASDAEKVIAALGDIGISCTEIGEMTEEGCYHICDGERYEMTVETDELLKATEVEV